MGKYWKELSPAPMASSLLAIGRPLLLVISLLITSPSHALDRSLERALDRSLDRDPSLPVLMADNASPIATETTERMVPTAPTSPTILWAAKTKPIPAVANINNNIALTPPKINTVRAQNTFFVLRTTGEWLWFDQSVALSNKLTFGAGGRVDIGFRKNQWQVELGLGFASLLNNDFSSNRTTLAGDLVTSLTKAAPADTLTADLTTYATPRCPSGSSLLVAAYRFNFGDNIGVQLLDVCRVTSNHMDLTRTITNPDNNNNTTPNSITYPINGCPDKTDANGVTVPGVILHFGALSGQCYYSGISTATVTYSGGSATASAASLAGSNNLYITNKELLLPLSVGVRYFIPLGDGVTLSPAIMTGVLFHNINRTYSQTSTVGSTRSVSGVTVSGNDYSLSRLDQAGNTVTQSGNKLPSEDINKLATLAALSLLNNGTLCYNNFFYTNQNFSPPIINGSKVVCVDANRVTNFGTITNNTDATNAAPTVRNSTIQESISELKWLIGGSLYLDITLTKNILLSLGGAVYVVPGGYSDAYSYAVRRLINLPNNQVDKILWYGATNAALQFQF